ncbi:MAG TPA: hypothetical protein VN419_11670 [Humidesulfovibrio sp.]|uniref:hypothetical protein n=1 Tax=Humidesulfovibrio sp. TaxID=2910988 RepID=UPI002C36A5D7|nr:hypothetical protein [Humidesulfovibrio sp.]HWR04664.1 hypothetical protein [Humidesulfovibrio sp.]
MRILPPVPARTVRLLISLACLLLLISACAHMPRMLGGSEDLDLRLDGEQAHEASLPVGHVMVLDMRDPGQSGYVFSGTSFDPKLLRLDGIEPYDGGRRVRYTFTSLAEGECDVVIKIKRNEPGYIPDIFKRVRVTIGK